MSLAPRNPLPVLVAAALLGMALYACKQSAGGFGSGGSEHEDETPEWPEDSGPDSGDSTTDTGGGNDSAEDSASDTADTGPAYEGTGYSSGDVAYNLKAPDQDGDMWALYQHDDGPVVLAFGYGQSYNFQQISSFLGTLESDFSSYGLSVAAMLFNNEQGAQAGQKDAAAWAEDYDVGTVLYDPKNEVSGVWASSTQVKTYLIGSDMEIAWTNLEATTEEQLRDQIEDLVYE